MERIYNDNPGITAKQLYSKALREGVVTSRKTVNGFLSKKGEQHFSKSHGCESLYSAAGSSQS